MTGNKKSNSFWQLVGGVKFSRNQLTQKLNLVSSEITCSHRLLMMVCSMRGVLVVASLMVAGLVRGGA